MKKIVILFIAIFLLTGCAVKYNLVINDDLTVVEEAKLTGTDEFFHNYYKTTKKNVLKSFIDMYNVTLEENNYKYEIIDDEIPYVLVTKKYNSVDEYVKNTILFNGYFDEVKYTEDGNIKKIETIGYNPNEADNQDRFNVKQLEIAITCAYKVKNHNAANVDKITNTYFYKLDEENSKILLEYDASSKFNPNENLVRTLIICAIIIVVIWLLVYYSDKKNNKNN